MKEAQQTRRVFLTDNFRPAPLVPTALREANSASEALQNTCDQMKESYESDIACLKVETAALQESMARLNGEAKTLQEANAEYQAMQVEAAGIQAELETQVAELSRRIALTSEEKLATVERLQAGTLSGRDCVWGRDRVYS